MTSNKSKQGSKSSGNSSKCTECSRMEKKHTNDPGRDRFCPRHQCPVMEIPGIPCSTKKKSSMSCCLDHNVPPQPPCSMEGCNRACFESSFHCEIHSCSFRGCQKDARPGHGRDFCDDHRCSDSDCPLLRKLYEVDGGLMMAQFCRQHECRKQGCTSKRYPQNGNIPGKDYCVAHCCNIPGCPDSRQGGPLGPLCLLHYNESIKKGAFAEIQAQERLRAERAAAAEKLRNEELAARAAAEQQRRREQEARAREQYRGRTQTPRSSGTSFQSFHEQEEEEEVREERTTFSDPRRKTQYPREDAGPGFGAQQSPYSSGRTKFYEHPRLRREDAYREDAYIHSDYDDDRDSAYRSGTGYGSASKRSSGASFLEREKEEPVLGFEQKEPRRPREYPRPRENRNTDGRHHEPGW